MVGTTRFELATSRTPSERATRLRYVPKFRILRLVLLRVFVKHKVVLRRRSFGAAGSQDLAKFEQLMGQSLEGFALVVIEEIDVRCPVRLERIR